FHWTTDDSQVWPDPPALERLGEIGAPTVVAVGELDTPDLQGMAEALANGIPGAQKTVVRGAGHMSNMEKPDQVTELIIGHLTAG
ncbi:MAG TPA: alpha/beta hydrolase, partial [Chloroflexi bacterium]|nr:alpha/beta hydrolase [Chloroflexota bacterium]